MQHQKGKKGEEERKKPSSSLKDPTKLIRKHGRHALSDVTYHPIVVANKSVISKTESMDPWKLSSSNVLGSLIKTVDTESIQDDETAGDVVQAELERLKGELKDPSLQVIQLTDSFFAKWTSAFAIYKPGPDSKE